LILGSKPIEISRDIFTTLLPQGLCASMEQQLDFIIPRVTVTEQIRVLSGSREAVGVMD
jgi:hypothetical protein